MDYCENCGEPLEGRFCRMCGTPTGSVPQNAALAATGGYGAGYGATQAGQPAAGFAPQTPGYSAQAPGYEPEPTEMIAATPTEFEGLFRSEDGTPGAHGQTQMLPPVQADYRMQPPGGAKQPPGRHGQGDYGDEERPRDNRPVILATAGAIVVAVGLILGLLYLGNQGSSGSPTASSSNAAGPSSSATASQNGGVISVPTDGATLGPTASASASTSGAASFHGDSLPLGPGSSGSWVTWVQERLHQLGDYHGTASGTFDQATALAVQQFQASAGVTGDPASTVGMHTIVALESAGDTPNLRVGTKSSAVSRLNAALTYATGTQLSGARYTMETATAVLKYQQAVGLRPTGQVDAATWAKLQDGTLANG